MTKIRVPGLSKRENHTILCPVAVLRIKMHKSLQHVFLKQQVIINL